MIQPIQEQIIGPGLKMEDEDVIVDVPLPLELLLHPDGGANVIGEDVASAGHVLVKQIVRLLLVSCQIWVDKQGEGIKLFVIVVSRVPQRLWHRSEHSSFANAEGGVESSWILVMYWIRAHDACPQSCTARFGRNGAETLVQACSCFFFRLLKKSNIRQLQHINCEILKVDTSHK